MSKKLPFCPECSEPLRKIPRYIERVIVVEGIHGKELKTLRDFQGYRWHCKNHKFKHSTPIWRKRK